MGCDIHMHYEVKNENGWSFYDWKSEFVIGHYDDGSAQYDYRKVFDHPLYISRNYDLFAILANVRNGRGFAGIPTGYGFNPISEPRGLPEDVTSIVKEDSNDWGGDGHSHSWLSLSEVLNYNWNQTTSHYGVVGVQEYKEFLSAGKPSSWCGSVMGGSIKMVSNEEMDRVISENDESKEFYTRVLWEETYRDSVGDAWFSSLKHLSDMFGTDNVRLVFWFDN